MRSSDNVIPEIDVEELSRLRGTEEGGDTLVLIDVREPDEYADAHVPGAVLVPLETVPARAEGLPEDRPIYMICRSGARSLTAAEFLKSTGRTAVNVAGGTLAWVAAGKPYATGPEAR